MQAPKMSGIYETLFRDANYKRTIGIGDIEDNNKKNKYNI
jgi:hypothetical protein